MRFRLFLLITLTSGLLMGIAGCGDDDPVAVAAPAKSNFTIEVSVYEGLMTTSSMNVNFAMTFSGEIPSATFNGVAIEAFYCQANIVYAYVDIPYAETLMFEVAHGGHVVTGNVSMPTAPTVVTCNGSELVSNGTTTIFPASEYVFAWTGGVADYFNGSYQSYDGDHWRYDYFTTVDPTVTFTANVGEAPSSFSVYATNGPQLIPGADPNITSGWAEGFVSCRISGDTYYMTLGPLKASTVPGPEAPTEAPLHERLAAFLR